MAVEIGMELRLGQQLDACGKSLGSRRDVVRVGVGAEPKADLVTVKPDLFLGNSLISAFQRRYNLGSAKARFQGKYAPTIQFDGALPVEVLTARTPSQFEDEQGFEPVGAGQDRVRRQFRRYPRDDAFVADDVDEVDEASADGFHFEGGSLHRRDDAALGRIADRGEEMDAVAGERVRAARENRIPDRHGRVFGRIDRGTAVPVGARIGTMMVGVAKQAEAMTEAQPMAHRRIAVARPHGMQERAVAQRCFRTAVHRDHLDQGRKRFVEGVPVDTARAAPIADVMREGQETSWIACP